MKRTVLKVLCTVSGVLCLILAVFMAIAAMQVTQKAASVSIIGGADGPTAVFLMERMIRTPIISGMVVTFLTFSGTGLALLLTKKRKH